jgi:NitT/TauT family transport system substrate-binding protein
VLLPMANYGLKLYGNAIIVNSKFAAEKPDAVEAFLRAVLKGLKDTIKNPSAAVDSVLKREDLGKREVELERLRMVIRDNIVTPEVRANGLGAIDGARLTEAINQIALTYAFKAKPKASDVFDPAFLPAAADRKLN